MARTNRTREFWEPSIRVGSLTHGLKVMSNRAPMDIIVPPTPYVGYGAFYNWYSANDVRNIAAANAHVMYSTEWEDLRIFIDPVGDGLVNIAGTALKESGTTHWNDNNGLNTVGFNGRGAGERLDTDGSFLSLRQDTSFWNGDGSLPTYVYILDNGDASLSYAYTNTPAMGRSIRLIVDTPIEISGSHAIYAGNDGKRYDCVLINGLWYLAQDLAETKFQNGDSIPEVTDNTAWAALTTEAYCWYNNIAA